MVTLILTTINTFGGPVKWGIPGGDINMVETSGDLKASIHRPSTSFTTGHVTSVSTDPEYLYWGSTTVSYDFNASGCNGQPTSYIMRDDSGGDFLDLTNTTDTNFRGQMAWENFLGGAASIALENLAVGAKLDSGSDTGNIRFLVQDSSGWYISTDAVTMSGSYSSEYPVDVSTLSWLEYTPFSAGSETIGADAVPNLNAVTAVGFYFDLTNASGDSQVEIDVRYFEANAEPSSELWFANLRSNRVESDPSVQWQHLGPGMSGYCDMYWIHDTDPNAMFMALDMGNTHGTWNRGKKWSTIKDCEGGGITNSIQHIEFSHQDPDYGLALTKEGVFVSTNRGRSWNFLVDVDLTNSEKYSYLTVDPSNDNVWYAGAGQNWVVKDTHRNVNGMVYTFRNHAFGHIIKSTNKGQTWTKIFSIFPADMDVSKIIVDPRDSNTVYLACQYGVYRSTNAGIDWSMPAGNGLPYNKPRDMVSYYNESTGEFLLYLLEQTHYTPAGSSITTTGGVYRSADGGDNWTNITGNLAIDLDEVGIWGTREKYYRAIAFWLDITIDQAKANYPVIPISTFSVFNRIAVNPNNKDEIYLSHNYKHDYSFPPGDIWKTEDGGQNWFVCARKGEYWKSHTNASYWQARGTPLGENMTFSHVANVVHNYNDTSQAPRFVKTDSEGYVYSIVIQQTLRSTDNGATWVQIDDDETALGSGHWVGRGGSNLPGESICVNTGTPGTYLFGSGEHGLWRNTDDGDLVYPAAIAVEQLAGQSKDAPSDALSIATIAVHPNDPDIIYTLQFRQRQRGNLMRSDDGGVSWQALSNPIPFPGSNDVIKQYSLLIDPDNTDTIYFCVPRSVICYWCSTKWIHNYSGSGTFTDFGVYKSTDGGYNWSIVNNGLPADCSVHRLVFDPDNSQTLYAALNRTETGTLGGLYKTTNGGANWSVVSSFPSNINSVNHITINPTNGYIYAACGWYQEAVNNGGVWVSADDGATWEKIFFMPWVMKASASPVNPETIAVSIGNANQIGRLNPGMYISQDGGVTWGKYNTNLGQPERINEMHVDPFDENIVWLAQAGTGWYKGRIPGNPNINSAGRVDLEDLAIVARYWLTSCLAGDWCAGTDLDTSGTVDGQDLIEFCESWLE